jgi:hypothetical protein
MLTLFMTVILLSVGSMSAQSLCYQLKSPNAQEDNSQYIVDKLQRHFDLLIQFNKKNKKEHLVEWDTKASVPFFTDCDIDCTAYKHNLVVLCLKQMRASRTIDPFFETWSIFLRSYPQVESNLFLRETSTLLFCLYKNILHSIGKGPNNRVTVPEITDLYGKISLLPIHEVLFALDHCYIRLVLILKDYEFYSSMSWVQWIQKYWWLPPAITIGILYKIFFYKFVAQLMGAPILLPPK